MPIFISSPRNAGYIIIVSTFLLLILGMIGLALASMVAGGQNIRKDDVTFSRARYASLGGLEWAKREIDQGENPAVTGKVFATGTFDISMDPTNYDITSVGHNGLANVTYTIDTPVAANCVTVDTSNVQTAGPNMTNIKFKLNCNTYAILDKIQTSWVPDLGETLKEIKFPASVIYDNPAGVPSGTLLDVINYTLDSNNTPSCDFKFSTNMDLKVFTIIWTFKDTSQITSIFTPN